MILPYCNSRWNFTTSAASGLINKRDSYLRKGGGKVPNGHTNMSGPTMTASRLYMQIKFRKEKTR